MTVTAAGTYTARGVAQSDQLPRGVNDRGAVDLAAWSANPTVRRSTPRWMRRYVAAVLTADVLSALLGAVLAYLVRFAAPDVTSQAYLGAGALLPLCWVVVVHLCRGYEVEELTSGAQEFQHVLRAGLWTMAAVAFVSYALTLEVARGFVVIAIPTTALLTALGRFAARKGVHRLRMHGRCMKSVVAVGRERAVLDLVLQLRRDQSCGMRIDAACVPDPEQAALLEAAGVVVLGDLAAAPDVVRRLQADAVAVTSSSETAAAYLRRLSWDLEGSGVELLVAPGLMEVAGPRMHIRPFVGLPLLHVEEPRFTGAGRLVKGTLDRLLAGAAVVLLAPVMLLIAVAVRLDSPGPALFRQTRTGRGGQPFTMLKFRTMSVDAESRRAELLAANQNADGLLFKIADDPRITRVGKLLRRYSLDELPQLLNVLGGRMALVGPRPPLPDEVELYDDSVRRRLLVKPGLTGLWQVSGRSDLSWDESVRLDLRYVENWSLLLDILILWKTAFAVARARGAY
jgi:exopolysaccharide biosynthesis polyprenyl glycosylphosphotransferase